jgi:hypothetical protein
MENAIAAAFRTLAGGGHASGQPVLAQAATKTRPPEQAPARLNSRYPLHPKTIAGFSAGSSGTWRSASSGPFPPAGPGHRAGGPAKPVPALAAGRSDNGPHPAHQKPGQPGPRSPARPRGCSQRNGIGPLVLQCRKSSPPGHPHRPRALITGFRDCQ